MAGVEMTYVALKPLRVGGKRREPGELVPEAADWPRVSAWVDQGRITAVPESMVDADSLAAAKQAYADRIEAKKVQEEPPVELSEENAPDEGDDTSEEEEAAETGSDEAEEELTPEKASELSKEELRELAEEQGVELDGRWSVEKMVQVLFGDPEEEDGEG